MNNGTSLWSRCSVLLWGIAAGGIIGAGLMMLFAAAIRFTGRISGQGLSIMVWLTVLSAAFVSGLVSGIRSGRHGLWYGLGSGAVLGGILLLCGSICSSGTASVWTAVRFAGVLLCSMTGGVLGVNRRLRY